MAKSKVVTKFQKIKSEGKPRVKYKHTMTKPRAVPEKIQYLIDNEKSGKSTVELVREFQAECGHSYREIAMLKASERRYTYQVCVICGNYKSGSKKVVH